MDEQSYPLSPGFNYGCGNLEVPLQVNYCGYYYKKSERSRHHRSLNCWYLQLYNYRQFPGSDPGIPEARQFVLRRPDIRFPSYFPSGELVGYYWIYFTGNRAEELLKESRLEPDHVYTLQETHMEGVRQTFAQLFQEAAQKRPGYQTMITSLLMSILIQLGRSCHADEAEQEGMLRKRIEKSVLYIQEKFSDSNLSIAILAEKANLSESRYRELFREAMGITPSEFMIQTRIAHACHLLQTTGMSIGKIANCCGYQDIAYFSRFFRKKIGVSPMAYRKGGDWT